MITIENIKTKLDLSSEEYQELLVAMRNIEDYSPSESNVLLYLDKEDDHFFGSLKVISECIKIKLTAEDTNMTNLLNILNNKCGEEIKNWRKYRFLK